LGTDVKIYVPLSETKAPAIDLVVDCSKSNTLERTAELIARRLKT
jgi:hypothetical protein